MVVVTEPPAKREANQYSDVELFRCTKCGTHGLTVAQMALQRYHRKRDGASVVVFYWCRACKAAGSRAWDRKIEADPRKVERRRRQRRAASRRARRRDPAKAREHSRNYARDVRADPKHRAREAARKREYIASETPEQRTRRLERMKAAHAHKMATDPDYRRRRRETNRLHRAMRAAREGREFKPRAGGRFEVDSEQMGVLPAAPLGVVADRVVRHMARIAREPIDATADIVGVGARTLRRWRNGDILEVQFDMADRTLVALGLHWWDVWPQGVKGHKRARELFEGKS